MIDFRENHFEKQRTDRNFVFGLKFCVRLITLLGTFVL